MQLIDKNILSIVYIFNKKGNIVMKIEDEAMQIIFN